MFTGIIEELGKVKSIDINDLSGKISIFANKILEDIALGDSIAVNGVCLTISKFESTFFTADIMAETYRYTNLKLLKNNSPVNLERAISLNRKFGGHIVSGHIDGKGIITDIKTEGNSIWFVIETDSNILKYIIFKGSVAIDGISLTAAKVDENSFSISVTPHTIKNTTLFYRKKGDMINIETDIIAKYLEKLFKPNDPNPKETSNNKITMDFLIKNGF